MAYEDGDDLMKVKNVTIIGGGEEELSQEQLLKQMLDMNMGSKNFPGQTPMHTQIEEDEDKQ